MAADDRYTIPGSGGVLENKLGLTTQEGVDEAMNEAATTRWAIMVMEPIPDRLDIEYFRSIHRRLLSPVLDWAGEVRQRGDEVVAGGTGIVYARSEFFQNGLNDVFDTLATEDYLKGLGTEEFAAKLADRWGYLTTVHPFRDGNTRTQSAYVDRLATRAGHPIDWQKVDVPTLRSLRLAAVTGSERPLAQYLGSVLLEPAGPNLRDQVRSTLQFHRDLALPRESSRGIKFRLAEPLSDAPAPPEGHDGASAQP
ncbi:Fic family protein [Microbacterium esteraromaticum]|uniref:Fic/DOC family protein n=1 Tax=Microbacterium esteraromaticum TaxID=57043 RepID=UPI0023678A63|nr:Fic family protein [Microbacterium esteraromaticum]WDH78228.1 Fic family protein [Microbacterium esteraromaticum]